MIYKISSGPSFPKRGKEKTKITHSITRRPQKKDNSIFLKDWNIYEKKRKYMVEY
jgi:hypothetical protein